VCFLVLILGVIEHTGRHHAAVGGDNTVELFVSAGHPVLQNASCVAAAELGHPCVAVRALVNAGRAHTHGHDVECVEDFNRNVAAENAEGLFPLGLPCFY